MLRAGAHDSGSIFMQRDSLTLNMLLAPKTLAKQQTRKASISAGTESTGNAATSLKAKYYAKFT